MKALILLDGSQTSQLCLKAAYQDALTITASQTGKTEQEPIEVLLITAESVFFDEIVSNQMRIFKNRGQLFLDQAIKGLERCGEFDTVLGRVIKSNQANLTQALVDQAKDWQATTIYLPMAEQKTPYKPNKEPGWLSWLGIKRNHNEVQADLQVTPETPLTTSEIKVKQLLEQAQCRLVLINSEGIAMRLTYYPPATKAALQGNTAVKAGKSDFGKVA